MTPFAELDANGWTVIIAAIFLGLTQIVGMILSYLREQAKIVRDEKAQQQNVMHLQRQDAALETISKQTNGLVDKCVESSHAAGKALGLAEGMKDNSIVAAATVLRAAETAATKVLADAATTASELKSAKAVSPGGES